MITLMTSIPTLNDFAQLMQKTDNFLNHDALRRPEYYKRREGILLEDDVKAALDECAKGTPFENTIEKVSGRNFPDIVVSKIYGVEVKSTKGNKWTSVGGSILESSRIPSVEHVFITFGKLGGHNVEFLSRPYEECLSDITVTHMPRYQINMQLPMGESIFNKMMIPYECLRIMDNPIEPVAKYYKSQLKPGESLWWASNNTNETVSAKIGMWRCVLPEMKRQYTAFGLVNFPEIFQGHYENYALWLASQGIVDHHVRDRFSAGGKEKIKVEHGLTLECPAVYRVTIEHIDLIIKIMKLENPLTFNFDEQHIISQEKLQQKLNKWIEDVSVNSNIHPQLRIDYPTAKRVLKFIFRKYLPY